MTQCPICQTQHDDATPICHYCTFPLMGDEKEKGSFIGQSINFSSDIEKAKKQISTAQIILTLLGLVNLVVLLFSKIEYGFNLETIILFIPPAAFLTSAILLRKLPIQMAWLSLAVYTAIIALNAFFDAETIAHGLLLKIVVITSLVVLIMNMQNIMQVAKRSDYFMDQIFPGKKKDVLDELR